MDGLALALARAWPAWLGPVDRALALGTLVALRLAPMTLFVPWLAARAAPAVVRAALLVVLTFALTPIAIAHAPPLPDAPPDLVLVALREVSLGAMLAIAASLPVLALAEAGRMVDALRGAQGELALPDGSQAGPLGALHALVGTALFLGLGGHRLVLTALGAGLASSPPGAPAAGRALLLGAGEALLQALVVATSFAAPAALALIAAELVLGLVSRAAPQIPVHVAGMPLRNALALAAVLATLAVLLPRFAALVAASAETVARWATPP